MKDVVLSAKMSDQELLASIDATLKSSEQKFTTFASDINSILMNIGNNVGQNLSSNFGSQVDAMKSKIDELNSKIKSMERPTVSSGAGSVPSVNINDYNSSITAGLQQQDFELLKLNEHYRLLEISSQKAFNAQRNALKMDISVASKLPTNNIDEINDKLKRLQELKARISSGPTQLLNPAEIQSLDTKITNLTHKVEILQTKIKQPITMSGVMSMPEGNLNAIAAKMKAISELRGSYSAGAPELTQLNQAYQRLGKTQTEALTAGVKLEKNNHSLASSFENLGRRVMFYAGLGAITGFVVQLFNIRGEYEMLERSMGALLGNFQKGSELFNQIQAKALKSPLTVIDLTSAAKQLVAYNFAEDQVVDTTSRLADLSTALGVPIERLVYNLGQIKSKQILDSRDARDFANSGFAIVPMLAQLYTQQKRFGDQTVTTAQVYDMMTKKMVSYGDVMAVINKQTSEGGMFFDFQAKQAQTLKGQLSNLTDAWNMMLNEMGKENQGVMTGLVSGTRAALANWKEIERAIIGLIAGYGTFKAAQLVLNATMGQGAIGIKSGILAGKQKIATDLMMKQAIRELTLEEQSALAATKSISAEEYAAALKTKGFTNEQLMLRYAMAGKNSVTRQAIVATGQLTEAEIANAAAMGRSGAAMGIVSMGLTKMGMAVKTFFIANWPLLAITAAISLVTYLINKHEEHKQKVQELNDEYNNLRKNIADISVNFKVAVQKNDIEDAKSKLEELIKFAKDEYSIVINVDTSKMNTKEIVKKFNDIKNELNDISISSEAFSEASIGSGFGDEILKYGEDLGKMYGIITNNKSTVIEAVQSHIEKLKALGGQTQEVAKYQAILNNIMTPKRENESQIDYLNRLIDAYGGLGIFANKLTEEGTKAYNRFEELGISGDKTFSTLRDLWNGIFYHSDPTAAWIKQLDELAKSINFDNIPKEKRTIKLEAAINKLATDQKWNEFAKEQAIKMANARFHINIGIETDKASQNKATLDLTNWRDNLQDYFNKHGFQIGVDLKTANAGEIAQKAGSEYESRKGSVQAIQNQLAYSKAQLAIEEKRLKTVPSISKDYAFQSASVNVSRAAVASLTKELEKAKNEVTEARNAAQRAGYDFKKENQDAIKSTKERASAQKKAQSEEAQAIKNEIDLIDKLSSNYDKLVGAGMPKETAISFLAKEYKRSIGDINNTLDKYKLPKFKVEDFAGTDVSGQLAYLEKLRDAMKSKGLDKLKPDAYKEVSLQIEKIKVDAKTYDLSRITDGLQESLSNIKESYELGIEIDSDPQMGELFADMFKIDPNTLIRTASDAIKALQDAWNEKAKDYNKLSPEKKIGTTDLMTEKPSDLAKSLGLKDSSKIIQEYKSFYDYARKIREDDFKNTTKSWDDLLSKYAEYEYKINEIQKTEAKQRLQLVQKFGTNEEYKQALDLSDKIQISSNPDVIANLQKQLSDLIDDIAKRNKQVVPIAAAITTKTTQDTGGLEWENFKKSDLYISSFEDMSRVATSSIMDIIYSMDNLKEKIGSSLSPEQMKAFMQSYKQARDEFEKRDPFSAIVNGLKNWKKATEDKKIADDELKSAEDELAVAQNRLNDANVAAISEGYTSKNAQDVAIAQDNLAKATDKVSQAKEKQRNADNSLKSSQEEVKNGIGAAKNGLEQFASMANEAIGIIKDLADGLGITFSDDTVRVLDNIGKAFGIVTTALGLLQVAEALATATGLTMMAALWPLLAVTAALAIAFTIFGSKNAKIDKEIKDSEVSVKRLENAYKNLEYAVNHTMGQAETEAKKAEIANKKLQLIELQRQLALEKSRSSKKRDESKIADLQGQIIDMQNSIKDLTNSIVDDLLGSDIKSAAEDFAKTWLDAWKSGENTMDSLKSKFTDMIDTMIVKSLASSIVAARLKNIYSMVDEFTKDTSEGGSALVADEIAKIKASMGTNLAEQINTDLTNIVNALGIGYGSSKTSNLSSLQQGIQNITEEQGGAIESYMNGVSGQVYLHTTLLQQLYANSNVSIGTQSQMLLQMQTSYQVQMSIQNIMQGWSSNNGRSVKVEII